ncbi:MAG: type II toxin-antitoxin system VapC family toxin [Bacteroidota bacterium]
MNVFIDANVLIATLNKEYPLFTWSSRVLSLQGKKGIQLYTSPLCLAIAFYFSSKKNGEKLAKNKIDLLVKNIGITKIDEKITKSALSNKRVNDFEDRLEYHSALNQNCRFIVTENQQDFYFSEIEVTGCEEFLKQL